MANERTKIDANQTHTVAGITYDVSEDITNLTVNPVDKRLRVDAAITNDTADVFTTYVNTVVTLTTATTAYKLPSTEQADRELLVIQNTSVYDVYIGGSAVTVANGTKLIPEATMKISSTSGIYAVSATDAVVIRVMECK